MWDMSVMWDDRYGKHSIRCLAHRQADMRGTTVHSNFPIWRLLLVLSLVTKNIHFIAVCRHASDQKSAVEITMLRCLSYQPKWPLWETAGVRVIGIDDSSWILDSRSSWPIEGVSHCSLLHWENVPILCGYYILFLILLFSIHDRSCCDQNQWWCHCSKYLININK